MAQNQTDQAGSLYQTHNDKPALDQQPVTIITSNGGVPGRMIGGNVVADKK